MNIQLTRVACTVFLCLCCISVCVFQIKRKDKLQQDIQSVRLLNWQNQQINQYIAHRISLAPHREPLGLSQWSSNKNTDKSFCETIKTVMKLPRQWQLISELDSQWQSRLNIDRWLSTLDNDSEVSNSMRTSYLKIGELPNLSPSLCSLQISTKIGQSNSISSVIKFSSKNNISLKE